MLDRCERSQILRSLSLSSKLGLLPLEINMGDLTVHPKVSKLKRWLCYSMFSLYTLNVLYKIFRLAQAFFLENDTTPMYYLIWYLDISVISAMNVGWFVIVYVKNSDIFSAIFTMTFGGIQPQGRHYEDKSSDQKGWKQWIDRIKNHSFQELLGLYVGPVIVGAMMVSLTVYVFAPDMTCLIYAALPLALQTKAMFWILLMEEFRFWVVMTAIATPVYQLHGVFSDQIVSRLESLVKERFDQVEQIQRGYKFLRSLELLVTLFNTLNRYTIFMFKIVSLTFCITNGYTFVAHFRDKPLFGILYAVIFVDTGTTYILLYEKAFAVPQHFNKAKHFLLLRLRIIASASKSMKLLDKQICSIAPVGIKVGEFHTLERESTPVFVDYVLKNIVSMLVAF